MLSRLRYKYCKWRLVASKHKADKEAMQRGLKLRNLRRNQRQVAADDMLLLDGSRVGRRSAHKIPVRHSLVNTDLVLGGSSGAAYGDRRHAVVDQMNTELNRAILRYGMIDHPRYMEISNILHIAFSLGEDMTAAIARTRTPSDMSIDDAGWRSSLELPTIDLVAAAPIESVDAAPTENTESSSNIFSLTSRDIQRLRNTLRDSAATATQAARSMFALGARTLPQADNPEATGGHLSTSARAEATARRAREYERMLVDSTTVVGGAVLRPGDAAIRPVAGSTEGGVVRSSSPRIEDGSIPVRLSPARDVSYRTNSNVIHSSRAELTNEPGSTITRGEVRLEVETVRHGIVTPDGSRELGEAVETGRTYVVVGSLSYTEYDASETIRDLLDGPDVLLERDQLLQCVTFEARLPLETYQMWILSGIIPEGPGTATPSLEQSESLDPTLLEYKTDTTELQDTTPQSVPVLLRGRKLR